MDYQVTFAFTRGPMDGNTSAVLIALITGLVTIANAFMNRHAIKQNNGLKQDASDIKEQVNGNAQALQKSLDEKCREIARLNRLLDPRGEPDRRQDTVTAKEFPHSTG